MHLFTTDHNECALALYGQLLKRHRNFFFSPLSIRTALGMTYAGARGETAAQMRRALRFASSNDTLHVEFAELIRRLNATGDGRYELAVANSLWGQDGAPLLPGFLEIVTCNYDGETHLVDFRCDSENVCVAINKWVEDKTHERIRDLISSLHPDTRLVVVNAVYFKGKWALPFREDATHDDLFFLEGGGTVQAPLMQQQEQVRYLQADGFQAVDLDYQGDELSLLALLPDTKDGLRDLEHRLSARVFQDCVAKMVIREVDLVLPRVKLTWSSDIVPELSALGMSLAFNRSQADFSGINGHEPPHENALSISTVQHQAFIEMNEQGTEAAAATAIGMIVLGCHAPAPVPIFRADHPFLFAIRARKSGAILFLGRVADPTGKG